MTTIHDIDSQMLEMLNAPEDLVLIKLINVCKFVEELPVGSKMHLKMSHTLAISKYIADLSNTDLNSIVLLKQYICLLGLFRKVEIIHV